MSRRRIETSLSSLALGRALDRLGLGALRAGGRELHAVRALAVLTCERRVDALLVGHDLLDQRAVKILVAGDGRRDERRQRHVGDLVLALLLHGSGIRVGIAGVEAAALCAGRREEE